MKTFNQVIAFLIVSPFLCSACTDVSGDRSGPTIRDISISGEVIVISDCPSTSATISAQVTDESMITNVVLWYRVESEKIFSFIKMDKQDDRYAVTLEGTDLQGHGYGVIEFYITAEDGEGNTSKSSIDKSIQFLPCVNN